MGDQFLMTAGGRERQRHARTAAIRAMRRLLAGMAVAVALIPASAHADYFARGNDLYTDCTSPMGSGGRAECFGYIIGFVDAMGAGAPIGGFSACFPPAGGVTQQQ